MSVEFLYNSQATNGLGGNWLQPFGFSIGTTSIGWKIVALAINSIFCLFHWLDFEFDGEAFFMLEVKYNLHQNPKWL